MGNSLVITVEDLFARGACSPWRDNFEKAYPQGLDLATFFDPNKDVVMKAWDDLLKTKLRAQLPWAWNEGLLPSIPGFVKETILDNRDLTGAAFRGADLLEADFDGSNLFGASFFYACLVDARFVGAKLMEADFQCANLTGADFQYADLTGADLQDVDLRNVDLDGAVLDNARYNSDTLFPKGFPPAIKRKMNRFP